MQRLCHCRPAAWRLPQDSPVPNAPDHAELLLAVQQLALSAGPLAVQLASTLQGTGSCVGVSGVLAQARWLAQNCTSPVPAPLVMQPAGLLPAETAASPYCCNRLPPCCAAGVGVRLHWPLFASQYCSSIHWPTHARAFAGKPRSGVNVAACQLLTVLLPPVQTLARTAAAVTGWDDLVLACTGEPWRAPSAALQLLLA